MYFVPTSTEARTTVSQKGTAAQSVEERKSANGKPITDFGNPPLDEFVNGKDKQLAPDQVDAQTKSVKPSAPAMQQQIAEKPPSKPVTKPEPNTDLKKDKKEKAKKEEPRDTSKTLGTFKIAYSVVAGFINSYLFGTPVWVAAGLSAIFAGSQTLLSEKIEREDTKLGKDLMNLSRKATHTEQDKSPGARERALAPVWGIIAAALALIESGFNDFYDHVKGKPKQTVEQAIRTVGEKWRTASAWMKPIRRLELNGLKFRQELEQPILKNGTNTAKRWLANIWKFSSRHIQGNKPLAYASAAISSFIGGIIQIHMIAQLQDGLEKHKFWFKRQGPA